MFISWICIIVFLLLLFFPTLSVQGASQGLLLWYQIVVPTLAPFMVVTQLVQAAGGIRILVRPVYPLLHRCFRTSVNGCYILLCGLLCGYPVGARLCADFCRQGQISWPEACCLLAVCNHPSPMFLLGYVQSQLALPDSLLPMLAAVYLPVPLLYYGAVTFYSRYPVKPGAAASGKPAPACPAQGTSGPRTAAPASGRSGTAGQALPGALQDTAPEETISFGEIILSTSETLVIIGGTLMLFSILVTWIHQVPFLDSSLRALLVGFLEITTGVREICQTFPGRPRLLPALLAVTFGGCSGLLQTYGVTKNAGLSLRHYGSWKLLHTLLSALILTLLAAFLPPGP